MAKKKDKYYNPRWVNGKWSNGWEQRLIDSQRALEDKTIEEIDKQVAKYYKSAMKKTIADFETTYLKVLEAVGDDVTPTPADLYKLDKYWQTQAQLQKELQKLGDKSTVYMQRKFVQQYIQGYSNLALPGQTAYTTIDKDIAKQIINQIWVADGKSWSQRIWENTAKLGETLNEEIVHCVVTGKKSTDLKKLLQERFECSYYEADRLVRTETAHIQTKAAEQRYKDYGITEYEIWADKDERRCETCGALHGKRYKMGEHIPVPAHPNCRCNILPVIED